MSRRLLQRQNSSTAVEPIQQSTSDRPVHELWLQSDNKQKTSENTKIQGRDMSSVIQGLVPSLQTNEPRSTPNEESTSTDASNTSLNTSATNSNMPSLANILNMSPTLSSPGSIRSHEEEQDNTLLNQLQVRRARPEHSPSDLSPNFSPSFSPRFLPQTRPRTLMAYLQNFGQNPTLADQTLSSNTQQQQPRSTTQGDPSRTAGSFFSRIFGNNPPTPPQNEFFSNRVENTNTDEAIPTSNEVVPYQNQQQQQIANAINTFSGGAIIVRTVQPGPNGSMIVNMRVLSLEDVLNNNQEGIRTADAGNSELLGSLMNILAGLQGVNMFTFGDLSGLLSGERGLDKSTIDSLPAVKYDEETFKNVDPESKKCTICLDDYEEGNEVKYLWCLHRFHTGCVDQWLEKHSKCPVCKKDFSESQDIVE